MKNFYLLLLLCGFAPGGFSSNFSLRSTSASAICGKDQDALDVSYNYEKKAFFVETNIQNTGLTFDARWSLLISTAMGDSPTLPCLAAQFPRICRIDSHQVSLLQVKEILENRSQLQIRNSSEKICEYSIVTADQIVAQEVEDFTNQDESTSGKVRYSFGHRGCPKQITAFWYRKTSVTGQSQVSRITYNVGELSCSYKAEAQGKPLRLVNLGARPQRNHHLNKSRVSVKELSIFDGKSTRELIVRMK